MISDADLHSTIANMWAVFSFIYKDAHESELWKKVTKLQKLWTRRTGKEWLAQNRATAHLICCLILEVHTIITHYVRIANSLEYRQAVRSGNAISPQAFILANKQSEYIVTQNQEMISRMNLGCFRFEPSICRYFTTQDQSAPANPQASNNRPANRARIDQGGNSNRSNQPGARTAEGRAAATGRNPEARPAGARGGPPTQLSQEEVNALKQRGLLRFTGGEGRIPQPVDIFERNGSGLVKICMNFLVRDRFCRYGDTCNMKHIASLNDFTPANRVKFQTFVQHHNMLAMANPGTNR
jgi:hypothetical protein